MAKFNAIDILGGDDVKTEAAPAASGETSIKDKIQAAKVASQSKPSPFEADLRAKLRDKAQFSFGHLPRFVVDIFDAQASKAGMNRREYFYELLRDKGGAIPPYEQMDGRKL